MDVDSLNPRIVDDEEESKMGELFSSDEDETEKSGPSLCCFTKEDFSPPQIKKVDEIDCTSKSDFNELVLMFVSHYRNTAPVIFRNFAQSFGVVDAEKWKDQSYLASSLDQNVLSLQSKDNLHFLKRECTQTKIPFSDLVKNVFDSKKIASEPISSPSSFKRTYGRAPVSGKLKEDVDFSPFLHLMSLEDSQENPSQKDYKFNYQNCGVWVGSSGNITPLHYDLCHGFLLQVVNKKTFSYFSPDDYLFMYQWPLQPELSRVNLSAWRDKTSPNHEHQQKTFPKFAFATQFENVVLSPGDALYTPPFWWHHVETGEAPAVSLLVPFDPPPSETMHKAHFC